MARIISLRLFVFLAVVWMAACACSEETVDSKDAEMASEEGITNEPTDEFDKDVGEEISGSLDAGADLGELDTPEEAASVDGGGDLSEQGQPECPPIGQPDQTGDYFTLQIPGCVPVCTMDYVNPLDLGGSLASSTRVTFRTGNIKLYRDLGSFPVDCIQRVEVGPSGATGTAKDEGILTRELTGSSQNGTYLYTFTQSFDVNGSELALSFKFEFQMVNGNPVPATISLSEKTFQQAYSNGKPISLTASLDGNYLGFQTCQYSFFNCLVHELEVENGDFIKMEQCNFCPPDWICKADPGELRQSLFRNAQGEQHVTAGYRMAHNMGHHNWSAQYLFVLNQPIGNLYGFYLTWGDGSPAIGSPAIGSPTIEAYEWGTVNYLDTNFKTIEIKGITSSSSHMDW